MLSVEKEPVGLGEEYGLEQRNKDEKCIRVGSDMYSRSTRKSCELEIALPGLEDRFDSPTQTIE